MQKCSKEALKLKLDNDAIKKSMLLYAITDRGWLKEGETLESVVEDVLKSGATFLQLREKIQGHEEIVKTAINLQTLCKKYNVPFVVNDDIMAAKEIDADGVHIGHGIYKSKRNSRPRQNNRCVSWKFSRSKRSGKSRC